jgi:hypothetical protein
MYIRTRTCFATPILVYAPETACNHAYITQTQKAVLIEPANHTRRKPTVVLPARADRRRFVKREATIRACVFVYVIVYKTPLIMTAAVDVRTHTHTRESWFVLLSARK